MNKRKNFEEPWIWREFDSIIREIFSNSIFFGSREKKTDEVPLSQPETFVDLKESVNRRRKYKHYF